MFCVCTPITIHPYFSLSSFFHFTILSCLACFFFFLLFEAIGYRIIHAIILQQHLRKLEERGSGSNPLRQKCPCSELFWSVFYSVFLRNQSECGKIRTRIIPNTETFYAVIKTVQLFHFHFIPNCLKASSS